MCAQRADATLANFITRCIGTGGFGVNDSGASGRVTSVQARPAGALVAITGIGDANFTPVSPTYIVSGTRLATGQVIWDDTTAPGTCLTANLC